MNTAIIASCMTVLPAFFNRCKIFHVVKFSSLRSFLFSFRSRSKSSEKSFASGSSNKVAVDIVDENHNYKPLQEETTYQLNKLTTPNMVAGGNRVMIFETGKRMEPEKNKSARIRNSAYF